MSPLSNSSRPIIKPSRLLLRPLERSDVADVHAIRSLPEVMKWTSHKAETSPDEAAEWIEKILSKADGAFNFCVEELPLFSSSSFRDSPTPDPDPPSTTSPPYRQRVIGIIGAHNIPFIGYLFHPSVWGKGYATEALTAYLPLYWEFVPKVAETAAGASEDSNSSSSSGGKAYNYAIGETDPENRGSRNVMLKCGFEEWSYTYQDFQSPSLGLRDSVSYRVARPGTVLKKES